MPIKVLHAADLHIDSPLRGLPDDGVAEVARLATRRAFERLVDLALAEGVAVVLLAGDVFDRDWKDFQTGVFFTQQVKRLTDAGARVFMVLGNHDAAGTLSRRLLLPPGARVFGAGALAETEDLAALGIAVHGWSFPVQVVAEDPLPRFPPPVPGRVNFGLLHTNLDGGGGHENYAPTRSAALLAHGYDYWALGHVHNRAVIADGGRFIVYPGNLQGRHVREAVPVGAPGKGATLVTVDGGRVVSVAHRALEVLRWREVVVTVGRDDSVDAALHAAADAVSEAVAGVEVPVAVRVRLTGACAAHGALLGEGPRLRGPLIGLLPTTPPVLLEELRVETAPARAPVDDALERALAGVLARVKADPAVQEQLRAAVVDGLPRLEAAQPELRAALDGTAVAGVRAPGAASAEAVLALAAAAHDVLRARLGQG